MSFRTRRLAATLLIVLGGLAAFAAPASAAPDLSGVWWIKNKSEVAAIDHKSLPLTPLAAAQFAKNQAVAKAGKTLPAGQNPCILEGMPRMMLSHLPFEIVQKPEQITILHESRRAFRLIYIDQPHHDDPDPSYVGDSTGHWDGDALVVDTIALKPNTVLDATGIPHSDASHLTERFTLADGGKTLRDAITVEDPNAFTRPWSFTVDYAKRPDIRLMEDVCPFGAPQRDTLGKQKKQG
jgi:hypothetical protein